MIHRSLTTAAPPAAETQLCVERPTADDEVRSDLGTEPLTAAERAVWNDPEQLGRIEAVLDDPSLAVPLEDLD